jgi:trimeric autotransporter adhesin
MPIQRVKGITAIGYQSLLLSTGIDNTALGFESGVAITTGNSNTILGFSAAASLTTGDSNVVIGSAADTNAAGNSNSVIIGAGAQGQQECVVLGSGATATGNNQFVVGSATENAGVVAPTGDLPCQFLWNVKINGTDYNLMIAN